MNFAKLKMLCLMLSFGACLSAPALTIAAKRTIEVNLEADFVPEKAVGIVITPDSVSERPALNIKQVRDDKFVISVQLTEQDRSPELSVSALAIGKDGQRAYADTQVISAQSATSAESFSSIYNLPYCPSKNGNVRIDQGQIGVFQTLVDYRRKRFELAKLKLARAFDDQLLAELQKLEKGFGLTGTQPLAANLPITEIIDRLTRLKATIANHELMAPDK